MDTAEERATHPRPGGATTSLVHGGPGEPTAERELQSSEEELRDFFENATVALHWVGPDGKILWANRAELELLGYSEAEYIGRPISEFHADQDAIADILARLGRRETLCQFPCRLRAKDGSIKHVIVSSNIYERDGRFIHTRCFTLDVTHQRHAEAEREAAVQRGERLLAITAAIANAVSAEQVYEAIVDHVATALGASTAALWVQSHDGRFRLMRSIGYTAAAAARFQVLSDADATPALDAIRERKLIWLDSQQQLLSNYAGLSTAATPQRSYQICCLPLTVGDDRCHGALGFTFERTPLAHDQQSFLTLVARYAAQALERLQLLHSEQQNRARAERAAGRAELLYDLARALMSAERVDDVFESGLDAIAATFGTARAAVLVFDDEEVLRFRAWRGLSDAYRRAVEGHSPWSPDERDPQPVLVCDVALDASLSAYTALFATEQIGALGFIPLVAGGRLIGKFMVYYEGSHAFSRSEIELATAIANHFAAAIARFQMIAALQESVRFNEMFTGMLGHDLRNPLGAIVTAAQVAMERQADPRIAKPLTRILSSGDRMARMIDQLLDFTRVRVGKGIPLYFQAFDIAAGLRQVVEEFEDGRPGWALRMTVRGDLTGRWDGDRLLQVFSNVIANAIQHGVMAHGVDISADGTAPDAVCIEVHNMGGIPENLLASVFEPMTGGERRQNNSRGLGLGLFITREIVRAHHGQIDVCSSEAEGTTFRVLLPRGSNQELADR